MRKCIHVALLLAAGLTILAPMAMAQDAVSALLPAPWTSRPGSQLVYYYEDGIESTARGQYVAFLTVTNTNIVDPVTVHVQIYTRTCQEWIDFVDVLTPSDTHVYSPAALRTNRGGIAAGSATNGRYLFTITAIDSTATLSDRRAIAFNHLSGQLWVSHIAQQSTWMLNAIPRMAVTPFGVPLGYLPNPTAPITTPNGPIGPKLDAIQLANGALISNSSPVVGGPFGPPLTATSTIPATGLLQLFRPDLLLVNSFFAPATLHPTVPHGNRLSLITFRDDYALHPAAGDSTYKIKQPTSQNGNGAPGTTARTTAIFSLLFDDKESIYSPPPQQITCWDDFVIGFDSAGDFPNFIGAAASPTIFNTGGWLRMRPAYANLSGDTVSSFTSIFGSFSQSVGVFGGGDLLIGVGRRSMAAGSFGGLPVTSFTPDWSCWSTPPAAGTSTGTIPNPLTNAIGLYININVPTYSCSPTVGGIVFANFSVSP